LVRIYLHRIGRSEYDAALALQRRLHRLRVTGEIPDVVVVTEHSPVITLGRNAVEGNVLAPRSLLREKGIPVVRVERGGDVTFHGPGQIVIYPVVDLRASRFGVSDYVWALEEAAITVLARYRVEASRRTGFPGVWAGAAKIASVGVFVSRWVTMHGMAINIDVDLAGFDLIQPCGLEGVHMTSLADVAGASPPFAEVEAACASVFGGLLELRRPRGAFTPLEAVRETAASGQGLPSAAEEAAARSHSSKHG
jgi:lipoate-protein ligase B